MHIQADDKIAGKPVLEIRELLRQCKRWGGTNTDITEQLNVDLAEAQHIFKVLCEEGYIEPPNTDSKDERWHTTIKGNALAQASTRKPITRQTAERLVKEVLDRVTNINSSNDYTYYIKRVTVFGSYLSNKEKLGDVDLAVIIAPRFDNTHEQHRHNQERIRIAMQNGRNFGNMSAMYAWPYTEVFKVLRNRSSAISLHDEADDNILLTGIPSKILFETTSDKVAKPT